MNTIPTRSRTSLRWLAGGLAIGLLTASLAIPAVAAAQAQPDADETLRTINVNGVGRVKAEPDVADIQLGVTKQGKEAAEAAAMAAEAMDAVVASLLEMGIAENDIQTTSLNLNPTYDWDDNPPNIVGWEASNMVRITVRDVTAVGAVVDSATQAGATNVSGITFRVEDSTEAEAAARSAAVADARAKADQLAADAGVTITGVVSISEAGGQQPQPLYMDRAEMTFAAGDTAAETPVLPGEVELMVTVAIQYEIG